MILTNNDSQNTNIQTLAIQKTHLQKQIEDIQHNVTIEQNNNQSKIQPLQEQINKIEQQIQQLQKQALEEQVHIQQKSRVQPTYINNATKKIYVNKPNTIDIAT